MKLPSYYLYDRLPKGGNERTDLELSLLGGYSFKAWNKYHFADVRVGYRKRLHNMLSDQIKIDAKLGFSIDEKWQIIPAFYSTLSADMPANPTFTQSGQNDYHLAKLECNVVYKHSEDTFWQFGAFSHIAGRNTGHGYGVMISTGYLFQ